MKKVLFSLLLVTVASTQTKAENLTVQSKSAVKENLSNWYKDNMTREELGAAITATHKMTEEEMSAAINNMTLEEISKVINIIDKIITQETKAIEDLSGTREIVARLYIKIYKRQKEKHQQILDLLKKAKIMATTKNVEEQKKQ